MEVPLKLIEKLLTSKGLKSLPLDLTNLEKSNSFKIDSDNIDFHHQIDLVYLDQLKKSQIEHIHVCVEKSHMPFFREHCPDQFEPYQFEDITTAIEKKLNILEKINKSNKVNYKFILREEILVRKSTQIQILFPYGIELTQDILTEIQKAKGISYKVQYSYKNKGILIYVNKPVENISLRIDLMALMASMPYPIYYGETVDHAEKLWEEHQPMITVFTYLDKAWESKDLFLRISRKDPIFKFVNYKESPSKQREEELKKIKIAYNQLFEKRIEKFFSKKAKAKEMLETERRKQIMGKIDLLRENYSTQAFVEMLFYLDQLGEKYNVRTIENILVKIKE